VDRDAKGVEIKTDVDVITDADCITMDDGDLRSGVKKMIDDRIGEVIDGAPKELDTLKEIATELEKNQSGVSTIIKAMNDKLEAKDLEDYAKNAYVSRLYDDLIGEIQVSVRDSYVRLKNEKNTEHMDLQKDLYQYLDKITEKKADKTDIADFKRCKVLTQSEYDALSTEEKNRADTLYFIKA
jgi:hypothetical protein